MANAAGTQYVRVRVSDLISSIEEAIAQEEARMELAKDIYPTRLTVWEREQRQWARVQFQNAIVAIDSNDKLPDFNDWNGSFTIKYNRDTKPQKPLEPKERFCIENAKRDVVALKLSSEEKITIRNTSPLYWYLNPEPCAT